MSKAQANRLLSLGAHAQQGIQYSRLVRLSLVLSVSLLGGSVSVHSASTRTRLVFIGHKNHNKLNRFSS